MEEALVEAERSLVRSLEEEEEMLLEEEGEAGMVEVEEPAWLHQTTYSDSDD